MIKFYYIQKDESEYFTNETTIKNIEERLPAGSKEIFASKKIRRFLKRVMPDLPPDTSAVILTSDGWLAPFKSYKTDQGEKVYQLVAFINIVMSEEDYKMIEESYYKIVGD